MEELSKNEKELIDMDNSVVITGGGWWMEVKKGTKGINGNGKNTTKNKIIIIIGIVPKVLGSLPKVMQVVISRI